MVYDFLALMLFAASAGCTWWTVHAATRRGPAHDAAVPAAAAVMTFGCALLMMTQ